MGWVSVAANARAAAKVQLKPAIPGAAQLYCHIQAPLGKDLRGYGVNPAQV